MQIKKPCNGIFLFNVILWILIISLSFSIFIINSNSDVYTQQKYLSFGTKINTVDKRSFAGVMFGFVKTGDKVYIGDYVYTYSKRENGWIVSLPNKTKSEYEYIYSKIFGVDVVSVESTFANCKNLVIAPIIPNTVINMNYAFENCKNLQAINNISDKVQTMKYTFSNCELLNSVESTPESVKDLSYAFYKCKHLNCAVYIQGLPKKYENCFAETKMKIVIVGDFKDFALKIAETSNLGNVKAMEAFKKC